MIDLTTRAFSIINHSMPVFTNFIIDNPAQKSRTLKHQNASTTMTLYNRYSKNKLNFIFWFPTCNSQSSISFVSTVTSALTSWIRSRTGRLSVMSTMKACCQRELEHYSILEHILVDKDISEARKLAKDAENLKSEKMLVSE